jgi:hypothetical protein
VLQQQLNTTEVKWEPTQASPYFNYRAQDGSIHQVNSRDIAADAAIQQERLASARGDVLLELAHITFVNSYLYFLSYIVQDCGS